MLDCSVPDNWWYAIVLFELVRDIYLAYRSPLFAILTPPSALSWAFLRFYFLFFFFFFTSSSVAAKLRCSYCCCCCRIFIPCTILFVVTAVVTAVVTWCIWFICFSSLVSLYVFLARHVLRIALCWADAVVLCFYFFSPRLLFFFFSCWWCLVFLFFFSRPWSCSSCSRGIFLRLFFLFLFLFSFLCLLGLWCYSWCCIQKVYDFNVCVFWRPFAFYSGRGSFRGLPLYMSYVCILMLMMFLSLRLLPPAPHLLYSGRGSSRGLRGGEAHGILRIVPDGGRGIRGAEMLQHLTALMLRCCRAAF